MTYFRSFFLNFLAVLVISRIAPGIQIEMFQKVPNIGASLIFAIIVGFLNGSVFPFFFIADIRLTKPRIAIVTFVISFVSFIAIAVFPFGVRAVTALGVILGGTVVWIVGYTTNYLEWHRGVKGP